MSFRGSIAESRSSSHRSVNCCSTVSSLLSRSLVERPDSKSSRSLRSSSTSEATAAIASSASGPTGPSGPAGPTGPRGPYPHVPPSARMHPNFAASTRTGNGASSGSAKGKRLAAADDEPDGETAALHGASPRALRDHAANPPRAGSPDTTDRAVCAADLRSRPAQGQPDHSRHPAAHRWRRWRRR